MSAHTPGPWEQGSRGGDLVLAGHDKIALVNSSTEAFAANARLISAAPDLLAAARLGLEYMLAVKETYMARDIEKVRAAIAKAEGKS